jgi:cobalt-zinc-cadmium resistance protein CzcA
LVFKGDRRFQIVVRLSDAERNDVEALKRLPVTLPEATPNASAATIALQQLATFRFSEGPNQVRSGERQAAGCRDGQRSWA